MALVCVPITVTTPAEALVMARQAKAHGADIVEYRIDGWFTGVSGEGATPHDVATLVAASPAPCVVTCRDHREGGRFDGPHEKLIDVIGALSHTSPSLIDLEVARYAPSPQLQRAVGALLQKPASDKTAPRLVLSFHDFDNRPPDLVRRCTSMAAAADCSVVKIAFRARTIRDNLELLDLTADCPKPMIGLAMGEHGLLSRVLTGKFGGFLTFASLGAGHATAPGQPTLSELLDLYHFRSIGSGTAVYGLLGWPVSHSLSPAIHNAGFEAVSHNGVYLPLAVAPQYEPLKATLLELIEHPRLDFGGCSVTIPHKEHLVRLAREMAADGDARWTLDALSARCGAANTVVVRRDEAGEVTAVDVRNTDGPAAARLLDAAPIPSAAIIGTGGTTRALAAALSAASWRVRIVSRDHQRAQRLVNEMALPGVEAADARSLADQHLGALINCTPVGMAGGPDPAGLPVDRGVLRNLPGSCVVADVVYNPLRTPLLQEAAGSGRTTISGLSMFLGQAAEQFRSWTGVAAPIALFEKVARAKLDAQQAPPPLRPGP